MTQTALNHRLMLVYRRPDGDRAVLGRVEAAVDLAPAWEAAKLAAARRFLRSAPTADAVPPIVAVGLRPVWDAKAGPPHCAGIDMAARCGDAEPFSWRLGREHFKALARTGAGQLVESGQIAAGATYHWELCALPREPDASAAAEAFNDVSEPLPLRRDSLAAHVGRSIPEGGVSPGAVRDADSEGTAGGGDGLPIFIHQSVLDEARALADQSPLAETGGFLLGSHGVDPGSGELFVMIHAQIPAAHVEAAAMTLNFTDQTWTALRAAVRLRRDPAHVRLIGWWHHHPVDAWCAQCPEERRRVCDLRTQAFFSSADGQVMRRAFPRASSVGLLLTVRDGHTRFDVFGWRQGAIAAVGWHRLDGHPTPAPVDSAPSSPSSNPVVHTSSHGDPCHATS